VTTPNYGSYTFSKINDKDDNKIDAITHFNMRLDCCINGSSDFKCFNFQLVLVLHTSTNEELYDAK